MKYTIYMQRNNINGKVYVGLTSKSVQERWFTHCKKAKHYCKFGNGNYFQRAIVKYGISNWDTSMLEVCGSLEEAEAAERKWISHYNSNDRKFGYNLTEGGNVSQSSLDPRVRQKISKSVSKIVNDPINKERQSNLMKRWHADNDNPFLGKQHSLGSRRKISATVKKWHQNNDNPFLGKRHTERAKEKMRKVAKARCSDPNWVHPMKGKRHSPETIKKMQKPKNTKTIATATELIELARQLGSQLDVANFLSCTSANISYLTKKFNIRQEFRRALNG